MNIASVKFKGIESNIYTRTKQQIQQTTKVSSKDTVEIYIPKTLTQDDIGCLFASNHYVKFNISPKNKKYGVANGCI